MRNPVAVVAGVVMVLAGSLFTLQGLGYVGGSPMSGVDFWAIAGPAIAGLGVALVIVGSVARGATDQESRSSGFGGATNVTPMDIKINASFLPHSNPDESLAFFRDVLGFEVRNDVGYEGMRWITVGPAGQPDTNIVLHPPAATPGLTDDERRMLLELMAKGTYFGVDLARPTSTTPSTRSRPRRRGHPGADGPAVRRARLRVP